MQSWRFVFVPAHGFSVYLLRKRHRFAYLFPLKGFYRYIVAVRMRTIIWLAKTQQRISMPEARQGHGSNHSLYVSSLPEVDHSDRQTKDKVPARILGNYSWGPGAIRLLEAGMTQRPCSFGGWTSGTYPFSPPHHYYLFSFLALLREQKG